jgi:hypothetical protein
MSLGQTAAKATNPAWSGVWWEQGDHGFMSVAHSDEQQHLPPDGWTLLWTDEYPSATVFMYQRVQ